MINIVLSSPFFIALLVIVLLTVLVLIFNRKKTKKWQKILVASAYLCITTYILITYWDAAFSLSDALVDKIFTALYFPNYISYICMLVISLILFVMTLINKRLTKFSKVSNVFCFLMISFLFVLILDTITKYGIDVYDKTDVYQSSTLMVLIQSSMGIFAIWILVLLIDLIAQVIVKYMNKKNNDFLEVENVVLNKKGESNNKDAVVIGNNEFKKTFIDNSIKNESNIQNFDKFNSPKVFSNDENLDKTISDFDLLSDENFYKYYKKKEQEEKYEEYQEIILNDDDIKKE